MSRVAWATLLLSLSLPVVADDQFWVAVGSYSSMPQAEKGRTLLEQRLSETLAILPADATGLPPFRVVAGPYSSRNRAADSRSMARAAGIEGAWILRISALDSPMPAVAADYGSTAWSSRYSDYPELDEDPELGSSEQLEPREKKVRTLVEEAPADYQLHKLKRQ